MRSPKKRAALSQETIQILHELRRRQTMHGDEFSGRVADHMDVLGRTAALCESMLLEALPAHVTRNDLEEIEKKAESIAATSNSNNEKVALDAVKRLVTSARNPVAPADGYTDAERLDFLAEYGAHLSWSKDHEVCSVARWDDSDGDFVYQRLGPTCDTPREAIDAAITEQRSVQAGISLSLQR